MREFTSKRCVIPGVNGTSGDGDNDRVVKRAQLDNCPVDDTITDFELSAEFGGRVPVREIFKLV